MQDENINSPEENNLPDFTDLEKSIDQLVEVVKTDFALREKEKNDLAAKEKKEQTEQAKLEKVAEEELLLKQKEELTELEKLDESLLETQTLETEYKTTVLSVQEDQAVSLEVLIVEIQKLNSNSILQIEKMDEQNDLIIESALTLIIAIVVVAAVKVFISQITKW